jgi:hypothetical protein
MSAPVYHGGGYNRGRGYRHRRWGRTVQPTGNGWLDQVSTWFGGAIPRYAGQGQSTGAPVGSGSPVYKPAPSTAGNASAALAIPQADVPVLVAPPR